MDANHVFLTRHHPEHDPRLCFKAREIQGDFCLHCALDILKANELKVKKAFVLTEFVGQVTRSPSEMSAVLQNDLPLTIHSVFVLIDLTRLNDEHLTTLVIEGIGYIIGLLNSVESIAVVLGNIVDWMLETRDVPHWFKPSLLLIGQLVSRRQCPIKCLLAISNGGILSVLRSALSSPDDIVNLAICSIVQIVQSVGWSANFTSILGNLPNVLVDILHNSHNKELQANSLALLCLLITTSAPVNAAIFGLNVGGVALPLALKRFLLGKDKQLMISSVQCISLLLRHPTDGATYISLMLRSDVVSFLFEAVAHTDEALVESLLGCCSVLAENDEFYNGCVALLGMNPIVQATEVAFTFCRPQSLILAFQYLSTVLDRQPPSIPLFSCSKRVIQMMALLKQGLECPLAKVSISAMRTLEFLLRPHHLHICPVPIATIHDIVSVAFRPLSSYQKTNSNSQASKEDLFHPAMLLGTAFDLAIAALKLCVHCESNLTTLSSTYDVPHSSGSQRTMEPDKELESFKNFVLSSVDRDLVPSFMLQSEQLKEIGVYVSFLDCLMGAFEVLSAKNRTQFAKKLCSSGIFSVVFQIQSKLQQDQLHHSMENERALVKRNEFLSAILSVLIADDERIDRSHGNQIISKLQENFLYVRCLPGDALAVLNCTSSDPGGQAGTITTVMTLCYYSHLFGHPAIPTSLLLPSLCNHLVWSDSDQDPMTLRFFVYLMAVCSMEWVENEENSRHLQNYAEAVQALLRKVCRLTDRSVIFTHNEALLKWAFTLDDVTEVIGNAMMKECVMSSNNSVDDDKVFRTMVISCENFRKTFVTLLTIKDDPVREKALEKIGNWFSDQHPLEINYDFACLFLREIPGILITDCKDDTCLVTLFNVLSTCLQTDSDSECNPDNADGDEDNLLRILHQIIQTIHWAFRNERFQTFPAIFRSLNLLMARFNFTFDFRGISCLVFDVSLTRIFSIITAGDVFIDFSPDDTLVFLTDFLMILAALIELPNNQKQNLDVSHRVVVQFSCLCKGLFSSVKELVLASLNICSYVFSCEDAIPILLVENVCDSSDQDAIEQLNVRLVYDVLLNLLVKEKSSDDVRDHVVLCLLNIVKHYDSRDTNFAHRLIQQDWTAIAIKIIANGSNISESFLEFLELVADHLTNCPPEWFTVWLDAFSALLLKLAAVIRLADSSVNVQKKVLVVAEKMIRFVHFAGDDELKDRLESFCEELQGILSPTVNSILRLPAI